MDSGRFAELTAAASRAADPRTRAELLTQALALWRAEPFSGLGDPEFVRAAATQLAEQQSAAVEMLAETRLELGEHHALVAELGDLAARYPLRERLRALQITALYRAGQQSEALAVYTEVRNRLADELGVDPGPELSRPEPSGPHPRHRAPSGTGLVLPAADARRTGSSRSPT